MKHCDGAPVFFLVHDISDIFGSVACYDVIITLQEYDYIKHSSDIVDFMQCDWKSFNFGRKLSKLSSK